MQHSPTTRRADYAFAIVALLVHFVPLALVTAAMVPPGDDFRSLAMAIMPVAVVIAVLQLALMLAADRSELVGFTLTARGGWTLAAPVMIVILAILASGALGNPPPEVAGLLLVAAAITIAAFNEEFTFRGAVLGALLRHHSRLTALLVSSLLFGVAHLVALFGGAELTPTLRQCAAAALFGVALGLVRLRMPALWPLVMLHASWNIAVLMSGAHLTGDGGGIGAGPLLVVGSIFLTFAIAAGAVKAYRARRREGAGLASLGRAARDLG